jgi:hypothetical protein
MGAAEALAADTTGKLRLWAGAGSDSNVLREYITPESIGPHSDGVLSFIASGALGVQGESSRFTADYDGGVRKFLSLYTEDVLVQAADLNFSHAVGTQLGLGLAAQGKDRRGGSRDYTDLAAQAFAELVPDSAVQLRVHAGARRFLYWAFFPAETYGAGEAGVSARYRFDRRHSMVLFGNYSLRTYGLLPDRSPPRQRDQLLSSGLSYAFRGSWVFNGSYSFTELASNIRGESLYRHRLTASAGLRLPWKLMLLAQGALELSFYPQGFNVSGEINLPTDDDRHNSLSLQLTRPVNEHWELELRFGLLGSQLLDHLGNKYTYQRHLGWLGVTYRL